MTKAYKPEFWETVSCPFCDSSKNRVYEKFGSELQYTYVLCSNCQLVYQSPRPRYDQSFIDAAYSSYYQFSNSINLNDETEIAESSVSLFKKEIENLLSFDKERTSVLDIGSGMGTFLFVAKQYYQKAFVAIYKGLTTPENKA